MTPSLRLWPGVAAVAVQWLLWFALPLVMPEGVLIAVIGGVVGGLAVAVWWAFFSRAPRSERWGAIVLIVLAFLATSRLIHPSIATGMMGMMFAMHAIPVVSLAFVGWAVASGGLSDGPRRAALVAAVLLACGGWTLLRTDGITGDAGSQFAWRWSKTAEDRLLANAVAEPAPIALPAPPAAVPAPAVVAAPPVAPKPVATWPGFRGPNRDGIVPGVRIATDWTATPPVELWRRPVGPGWSSFAVLGDRIYTQEQRGDDEVVACYSATTGKPVWTHRDPARFWESNGGAGPRGTPTLSNGRVYAFGATGILNALDAATGAVIWTRNAATDTKTKTPGWGFSSSPLAIEGSVVVATAGTLAAYDAASGNPRWTGAAGGGGYSSPHAMTIGGVAQIVLLAGNGALGVAPADGATLWEHKWPSPGSPIVQPALAPNGDVLLGTGDGAGGGGLLRLAVARGPGGWTVQERWTSRGLKPYFNDFVIHAGHAYGFDGGILACIALEDGQRKWKGGRYGHGQLVLLPDQDAMLVLSEEGELALVAATAGEFKELARIPAIEGKTWNHPVLAGDLLLVRNGQEMVAFRLTLARS